MSSHLHRRWLFIGGLLVIVVVYVSYKLIFLESSFYYQASRSLRYALKFGSIAIVYAAGFFVFKRDAPPWLLSIWHSLYIVCLLFLLLIAAYEGYSHEAGAALRGWAITLHEALISPVPYVVMHIVSLSTLAAKKWE